MSKQYPIQFENPLVGKDGKASAYFQLWLSQLVNGTASGSSILANSNVKNAADFATGNGDLGAAITAASQQITAEGGGSGIAPGEIWVFGYTAGREIQTPAIWGYDQVVRFFGGGIYTLYSYMNGGYLIGIANGSDIPPVLFQQGNGANLPKLWQGAAVKGTVLDVTFDGNNVNNPTALDNIWSPFRQLFVRVKSTNATRHGVYLSEFSLDASGGTTFDNCSLYSNGGSGLRAEGCVDITTRGYTETGNNGLHGMDLFNCPGARLIGGDFASNQLSGLNVDGTTIAAGGLEGSLITIIGNQFGQNYQQDITLHGWDAVNGGPVTFDTVITGNEFWGGGVRNSDWPSIDLFDCSDVVIANNAFYSTIGGSEYRNAIRETSPNGHAGINVIGPNACTPPFAGLVYDLIPNLSIVHAGTGTFQGVSNYNELDVAQLGVRGGTQYLGGNYGTTSVLQQIFNFPGSAGGVTGTMQALAKAGVAILSCLDQDGNFGAAGTIGIGNASPIDPGRPGLAWSNNGVLVLSGSPDQPLFPGLGVGSLGFYLGGPVNKVGIAQFIYDFVGNIGNIYGTLLAIAESGTAALLTMDKSGNLGIAGTIVIAGAPTTDPLLAGRVWDNAGVLMVSGAAETPNFIGAGLIGGQLFLGGVYSATGVPQFIGNFSGTVAGITGNLFAAAVSGIAALLALDTSGNLGIAGLLSIGGAPGTDPGSPTIIWNNGGLACFGSFSAPVALTALGGISGSGFGSGSATLAPLTLTGAAGSLSWDANGCINGYAAPT